ncbi:acyltransferase [Paraburkholderia phytofirmans]|uniref:acyltransferase family protein n=1 Tax=Paraburkholderia phytofirmans TaxID=261302 RepID=UPI0038BC085A
MEKKQTLDALTSLRFFAAALIVVGHGNHLFRSVDLLGILAGEQAVSFFFVLSGFILAYTYSDRILGGRALGEYYVARFARVWPTHLLTAAIALLLIYESVPVWTITATNLLLLQAWIPNSDYFFSLNGVSWSISVEMLFYATFPFVLRRIDSTWHWKLAASIAIAIISMSFIRLAGEQARLWSVYIFPLTRFPEFVLGVTCYHAFSRCKPSLDRMSTRIASVIEIGSLAACVLAMWISGWVHAWVSAHHPSLLLPATWLRSEGGAPIFAIAIFFFAAQAGVVSRILRRRMFVFLGESSFALYMFHQIVRLVWAKHAFPTFHPEIIGWVCYISLSLAGAAIIHKWFEHPMRTIVRRAFTGIWRKPQATYGA